MNKFIFTNILLLFLSLNIFAQKKQNTEQITDKQLEKIQEKLKLDNIQLLMVKEILVKYGKEKKEIKIQEIPDQEKKVRIQEINLKQQKELHKFINNKQLDELKKIMKEHKKEFRKNRPSRKGNKNRRRRNSF